MSDERYRRRLFQKVKGMTNEQFDMLMHNLFEEYYGVAVEHYRQAMAIELQPAQQARVEAKALEVKELWDGLY